MYELKLRTIYFKIYDIVKGYNSVKIFDRVMTLGQ